jgi:hypothetical protein
MYAAIRTYETIDAGEVTRRANRGFVPILRGTPGFIAYYVVDGGDGKLASISAFEERAGAEESTRRPRSGSRTTSPSLWNTLR